MERSYGNLNGHNIGIILKEMVRRAIMIIRKMRYVYEATEKETEYKSGQDFVTDADFAAQQMYIKLIKENFPRVDVVAEEDLPDLPKQVDSEIFITVDPLDGTKAYIRRQSTGVATMIAMIQDNEVISACVGDVNSQELYYFRPDSDKVHRVSVIDEGYLQLNADNGQALGTEVLLLVEHPDRYKNPLTTKLLKLPEEGGIFKDIEINSGSIGIIFARLWKGEVGGLLLWPRTQMPWDILPAIGISQKMGFVFVYIKNTAIEVFEPSIQRGPFETKHDVLVVHESKLQQVEKFFR